jgi:hypothetical protein
MAGNVNNWTSDWYWEPFGRFCARCDLLSQPHLDDDMRRQINVGLITEKVDRGGGYATAWLHHEVLGCTRKVHWPPEAREPWNGFRTAVDAIRG